jgi:hypothetical protein
LWWRLKKEDDKKSFLRRLSNVVERKRKLFKSDHQKQLREIRIEGKKMDKVMIIPKELLRYRGLRYSLLRPIKHSNLAKYLDQLQ